MHPYYHYHYRFRGSSRILWFVLGAGAATLWHCSRQMREHRAQYFPCVMQPRHVQEGSDEHPTPPVYSKPDREAPASQEHRLESTRVGGGQGTPEGDMSESTLESIVSTVEALKTKLGQHKTQREQERKKYEEELERQKKEPLRYV
ncbi:hypothetical protein BDR07DRAFT_827876 [Suillus spraguei]|nr:hypothetical protein BDR07DRAFT_827876 [Suillus spraguei]